MNFPEEILRQELQLISIAALVLMTLLKHAGKGQILI